MSNKLFLTPKFITTPSQNGVGRYVCQLQRVVLKFCKNHGSSRGLREFIEHDLINYSKENPGTVVYLKPRRHRGPVIVGEYLNGDQQSIYCRNFSREEISKWLNLLLSQSGNHDGTRLRKLWHTEHPSIQGPWTPYTFRDPMLNLVKFPNADLSKVLNQPKTATEQLLELFEKKKNDHAPKQQSE
ncbi:hypothetical protein PPYR_04031 [Photinus pyralis]|uniref:Large ribosomal subunit protein mL43 n=1 Tax=Photinus pyralis TaxID=7054 RepID=A0A1Y1N6S8_PHOPY|nr:39S ribosomal protein L43, mitochondrial [Photinus pyralis]KAB0801845.1 hypothetical protein PPYR_04031 [Photinus pyralis]